MRENVAVKRAPGPEVKSSAEDVVKTFLRSVDSAKRSEQPYRHWALQACFPADSVDDVLTLPFEAPSLDGVSGKRELHNNTRKYFDVENRERFPVCEAIAQAFQDKRVTSHIEKAFGTVKYAQPNSHKSDDDLDLDVISRGGKILSTIQLMTGHKAFVITIRKYKSKKYHLPTREELPRMLTRLDSAFSKAFASNRLVCADIAPGIKGKDIPPGLSGRHAYAVLGYDQATHIVTVWNPHGKDYKPKASPPNSTNGYPVKKGVFEIPLKDFVRVFKAVTYETSASLTPEAAPKRRRGGA